MARSAFREIISLAKTKNPPFNAILVWKLNRFARNRMDSMVYKKLLKDRGIRVISMNEPLEDTPHGHMMEGIIETMDQFYSENMGEDIRRGLRESSQRGFYTSSRSPYGMHKVPVKDGTKTRYKLEPDVEQSPTLQTVKRIFDLVIKGFGCKEIAKTLNKESIRTTTGSRWGRTTVHKILTNDAYCGTLVCGGRPGHPALRSGIPPVRVENAWPAIINRETFEIVQGIMSSKKPEVTHPRTIPSNYLLSGFLFCSCGHAMTGRSAKSHRFHYYHCNGNFKQGNETCGAKALPKDKLERMVLQKITENVLNEEWLDELVELTNKELGSSHGLLQENLNAIDCDLSKTRLALTRLYEALETGKLSLDDLAPRIREQRSREAELSKTRLQVEAEMLTQGPNRVDAALIKGHSADLRAILKEVDLTASKAFLKTFVKRIEVNGEEATIQYTLPVPPTMGTMEKVTVLPIETLGGEGGTRTPTPCGTWS